MDKKIKRSSNDRVIAGVCGGFGEYFNIDPVVVRIIWVLASFWGGIGFVAYLICALIIPEDDGVIYQDDNKNYSSTTNNTPVFIGIALIAAGGMLLVKRIWPQFAFNFLRIGRYWPVLLIVIGLYIIVSQRDNRS